MSIRVLYFGELREHIGTHQDELPWLGQAHQPFTVQDLITTLSARAGNYAQVLKSDSPLKVAVNQDMANLTTLIPDHAEVALFRPVTGG
jgi:molybdopterin synthase sulfur carrier subunit